VLSLGIFGERQEERKEKEKSQESKVTYTGHSLSQENSPFFAANGIYVLNYVACHCNVTITSGYTRRNTQAFCTPSSLR
jgi:hypothetical protein